MTDMKVDLPYLVEEKSRHGRVALYVRKDGKRIRIRARPTSPDFVEEYRAARVTIGAEPVKNETKHKPNTFGWLVERYLRESAAHASMTRAGQRRRSNILGGMVEKIGERPMLIPRDKIEAGMAARAASPGRVNDWIKSVKALYSWAVKVGITKENPATGVGKIKVKTDGFHIWSISEIAAFTARHPKGTRAYLAIMLMLFTGLRREDASKFGRQHIRDGVVRYRAGKTGSELITAVAWPLQDAINAADRADTMHLVLNAYDAPFASGNALGNWFKDRCTEAGIPHCSAHGLRKAAASLAAEEGASDMILDAMFSWSVSGDNNQSRTYTRNASKLRLATEGFAMIERALVRAGILSTEQRNNKTVSVF